MSIVTTPQVVDLKNKKLVKLHETVLDVPSLIDNFQILLL